MHVERAFVICLHFILAVYGFRSRSTCIEDLTKVFTVNLKCPAREWIHVVHELYGDGGAGKCRLKSAGSCNKLLASSQHGLVVNCNGKQSCREAINNCNITDAAAEVKYNCIKGSMNMCSSVSTTVNGSVYLHSPGFPDSVGVNSSCVVRITGQTLQVTLVEQRMRSGVLIISGDKRQLWTNVNTDQYNMVLPATATQIVIVYDNYDQDASNLWIRVADSGQMKITITSEILDASSTPTSTNQPSRSQSTSGPSTSDTTTTETATSTQSTAIGSKATQRPSKSTTMVSTTVSITDTDKSTMTETMTGGPTTNTTTAVTTPKSTTSLTTQKSTTAVTTPKSTTAVTTPKSTTSLTTLMSATVTATNMTTKDDEASSTTTSSPEPGLIVWVASAVSGCVVTILIVVIAVVLCRKQVKKSRPLETPGIGHFELGSMNTEKHHNGFGRNETCHQCFVLDPEFVEGGRQSLKTEPGHRTETSGKNEQDQYAKALPLGSTVDMYGKSTFTVTNSEVANGGPHVIRGPNSRAGICGMTENVLYEGGFDDLRGGMIDNVVYAKFDIEREKESVHDEGDTSPSNSKRAWKDKCEMIENDVYDGGPPHLDDPIGSVADNDNPVGDLYDGGPETSEGMVDNGLYNKCEYERQKDYLQDKSDTSVNKSKQAWKDDCDMVENDAYERGPP